MLLIVIGLGSSLASSAALALEFQPPFDASIHVRVWPPGFVPETFGEVGISRLETALRGLKYPFYVLLSETLPGSGDEDARAQELTDGLAAAWARQGYDPGVGSVFALTFSPRKFSLLVGARWKTELWLADAALDPWLELFLRRVRGTPSDPVGGIIDMAAKLDAHIFDRIDPERVAIRAKEQAARDAEAAALAQKRALMGAVEQLSGRITEADSMLVRDTDYLPPDVSVYRDRVERAKGALGGSDAATMLAEASSLESDLAPFYTYFADAKMAAERRSMLYGLATIIVLLVLVFLVIFFFVRRAQLGRRRLAFGELADSWNAKITNAAGRYVEFYGKRDGILGLIELEGKTKALLDSVTAEVDGIYTSVAAMDAHIKEVGEAARTAHWYRLKPIDEALVDLTGPFLFDTGVLNEADLFGPQTKHLAIDPATFESELEARFASSLVGWKRLETAADLRFHEAAALLPQTLLDDVLAKATAERLPARWFADHPLFGDTAADQAVWASADAWRWKDAIAFLEAIDSLRARHDAVMSRLDRLVAVRSAVAAAHLDEVAQVAAPSATLYAAQDDPADTIEDARSAEADLEQRILTASDLEGVEDAAKNTVALYRKTADQTAFIARALERAEPEIQAAKRLLALSRERIAEARRQAEMAARVHLGSRALTQVGAVQRRTDVAEIDGALAEAKLASRHHVDALRAAERAKATFEDTRAEAERTIAYVDALEATRVAYEQRTAGLEQVHADKLAELRRYASAGALDRWQPEPVVMPADYAALTQALDQVVEGWSATVRRARAAWEEAERRRREAEEAERRRVAAVAAAARSRSSSWSSSSSSSSSRSAFSSSSSSSSRSGSWSSGSRSSSRSGSW